jgi:hypothetical protein
MGFFHEPANGRGKKQTRAKDRPGSLALPTNLNISFDHHNLVSRD